ncbi:MAG: GAF domain-containing sensor histidine kinase [Cyanobacteria bacterium]|nr:GAF domain-containing sensor histidine kinase [Cyanobacteriota bacterium]
MEGNRSPRPRSPIGIGAGVARGVSRCSLGLPFTELDQAMSEARRSNIAQPLLPQWQAVADLQSRLRRHNESLRALMHHQSGQGITFDESLAYIVAVLADGLAVGRASIWFYDDDRSGITCASLYCHASGQHSSGLQLLAQDYPSYFNALLEARTIAAHDAQRDLRTREFTDGYLRPLNIGAMLDAPLWQRDRMVGVLCCEHLGGPRHWTLDEENFVGSVADSVRLLMEVRDRDRVEQELRRSRQALEERAVELNAAMDALTQAQTQRQMQTEKLAMLGQMLAGIAHEINNPLAFLRNSVGHLHEYLETLVAALADYGTALPEPPPHLAETLEDLDLPFVVEDARKLLGSMASNADRICDLVAALKGQVHGGGDRWQSIPLEQLAENALVVLGHRCRGNNGYPPITLVRDYGPLPPVVCLPGAIDRAFVNLVANAIEALNERDTPANDGPKPLTSKPRLPQPPPPARTITLSTRLSDDGQWAIARVRDSGPGMDEAVRSRIFDSFFTTKASGQGTGMGLAIVWKTIVEDHGGRIDCRSQPGEGTEFEFAIPLQRRVNPGQDSGQANPDADPTGDPQADPEASTAAAIAPSEP